MNGALRSADWKSGLTVELTPWSLVGIGTVESAGALWAPRGCPYAIAARLQTNYFSVRGRPAGGIAIVVAGVFLRLAQA
jgi:hypothetical protein